MAIRKHKSEAEEEVLRSITENRFGDFSDELENKNALRERKINTSMRSNPDDHWLWLLLKETGPWEGILLSTSKDFYFEGLTTLLDIEYELDKYTQTMRYGNSNEDCMQETEDDDTYNKQSYYKKGSNSDFYAQSQDDGRRKRKKKIMENVFHPEPRNIFRAFNGMLPENVKVVILAMDPYHNGAADGLAFSVRCGEPMCDSLVNIFKKVAMDCEEQHNNHVESFLYKHTCGNLSGWKSEGVLLLNSTLTVKDGIPGSHEGLGWSTLTSNVVTCLAVQKKHPIVFLFWGASAKANIERVTGNKRHLVLEAPHPSPRAGDGFLKTKNIFNYTNAFLASNGVRPVNWVGSLCKKHHM